MSLAFHAMKFAREVHKDQVRKYSGNPYADHLAEVAGIASTVWFRFDGRLMLSLNEYLSVAWLHDCMEDQGITYDQINAYFGEVVANGVWFLSDMEEGNRAKRKELSRLRLAEAPDWVQTIKVADLISNTSSIVKHDPNFAIVYLKEKQLLLDVLTKADPELVAIARSQIQQEVV